MSSRPNFAAAGVPPRPLSSSEGGDAAGPRPAASLIPDRQRARWLAQYIVPHERVISAWLRRRCPHDLDAQDVLQETYAVLAALPCVDHITRPLSYAFRVAQSLVLRHDRRARIARMVQEPDVGVFGLAADEPSPERQVAGRQELGRVVGLVAALPPRCREAFTLRRIEGLSQRAAARQMGISEGSVEKHMGRALRMLSAAIGAPAPAVRRPVVGPSAGGREHHRTPLAPEAALPDSAGRCGSLIVAPAGGGRPAGRVVADFVEGRPGY